MGVPLDGYLCSEKKFSMEDNYEVGALPLDDDSGIEILGVENPSEDTSAVGLEGYSLSGEDVFMVDLGEGDLSGMESMDSAADDSLDMI